MNQGATEFMLGLGLEGSMVGTAYLDDEIWPRYATAYATIPVLSSSYPNETHIMAQNPDFIVGSYNSAFRGTYESSGRMRGIFSNRTVGPCAGNGSDWGASWTTCRPQLHASGIGTYLFEDACEDTSLRPTTVTEDTVYEELRALASVFGVDGEALIANMQRDFQQAADLVSAGLISSGLVNTGLKTVWLDCVGRCCPEEQVFVGAGTGAPNMLMQEAGLNNVFSGRSGNWACVNKTDVVAADPDVIVVVDAAWDSAITKISYLYNDTAFCQLDVLRAARFVAIPFSATTLSPRNGPAALDLAMAALHVRTGSHTATQQSGVRSFNPHFLETTTASLRCPLSMAFVVYNDTTDGAETTLAASSTSDGTTTAAPMEANKAACVGLALWWLAAVGAVAAMSPY